MDRLRNPRLGHAFGASSSTVVAGWKSSVTPRAQQNLEISRAVLNLKGLNLSDGKLSQSLLISLVGSTVETVTLDVILAHYQPYPEALYEHEIPQQPFSLLGKYTAPLCPYSRAVEYVTLFPELPRSQAQNHPPVTVDITQRPRDDVDAMDLSGDCELVNIHKVVLGDKVHSSPRDLPPHFDFADSMGPPGFLALTEIYFQCSWPAIPPTPAMVLMKNRSSLRNLTIKYGTIAIQ